MLWREFDGAHGALGVDQHRALDPSGRTWHRAVELDAVGVGGGRLFPYFDSTIEGGGSDDSAKFGVCPANF